MAVAKYEPVIREEYLRISVKKVIFLFAIARLVKAGSITLPYPPEFKQAVLFFFIISGSTAALAVQGPVVYLAPWLQVEVQGPEVVGSAAASGSARTCFEPGSTAASGSARTRGSLI